MDHAAIDTQFADFVRAHTASLLRTAVLLTRSPVAAEELVQDTFAHLYPQWHKVAAADSPTGYFRRALVNRHLSEQRRPRLASVPERPSPDELQQLADRDQLRQLLADLPARQRSALILRYFHDLDDAGIAETMQCRIGTIRSLISRALATLRQAERAPTGAPGRSGAK